MNDNYFLPAGESASSPAQSPKCLPHRILVVEDDPSLRGIATEVLTRCGYEVDAAEDGAAAWDALNADRYDLMITDNNMPRVTGVELLKQLHASRMTIPVIMATGRLPTEEFARSPWLQPTATLTKPYTIEQLLQWVRQVLRDTKSSGSAPRQALPNSPKHILVVDEDRDLRQLYAEALTGPACQVDVAEDGAAGWEALQTNGYNLLIAEQDLPKLTGIDLVKKMRAAHMDLPVVMAAARLPTDQLAQNPSLHFAAILSKPFVLDELLGTVKNVLRAGVPPPEPIAPPPIWQGQPSTADWRL